MKKISIAFISLIATSAMANTTVVNFDDLSGAGTLANGYGGINWNSNFSYYDYAQFPYTPASGLERAYAINYGNPTFSFATPVAFDGMDFAGYDIFGPVAYEMYLGASLVATSGPLLESSTPTWLGSGYSGQVDSVKLIGNPFYSVMDNVTYRGSAVPGPAAVLPMLGGLIAIARKRRK